MTFAVAMRSERTSTDLARPSREQTSIKLSPRCVSVRNAECSSEPKRLRRCRRKTNRHLVDTSPSAERAHNSSWRIASPSTRFAIVPKPRRRRAMAQSSHDASFAYQLAGERKLCCCSRSPRDAVGIT